MSNWRLTLFRDDDTTPLVGAVQGETVVEASCSTRAADPRPYLFLPDSLAESEVDLAEGTSVIGQANVRVLDKRTDPADQRTGWLTALLGVPAGQAGAGESALNGRRALLEQSDDDGATWFPLMDGVIGGVTLDESLVTYALEIRDIRERERKIKAFVRADTASILPRGVIGGYGRRAAGAFGMYTTWLVPPVSPLRGKFRRNSGSTTQGHVDLSKMWQKTRTPRRCPASVVVTPKMREAMKPESRVIEEVRLLGKKYRKHENVYARVRLLWRYTSGSDLAWKEIRAPQAVQWGDKGLVELKNARIHGEDEDSPVVKGAMKLLIAARPGEPLPLHDRDVEVIVAYNGPPTEQFPLHLEGMTAGQLLKKLYDGEYCEDPGDPRTELRIRYDEAALLALATPVRARIHEPVDDLREWVQENVYKPLGAAPALDSRGRLAPVRYALPPAGVALVELNDQNTAPGAGWEHAASDAVNHVIVKYHRDYRIPVDEDPEDERAAGDGVAEVEVTIEKLNAPSVYALGDKPLEVDLLLFRAVGGKEGDPVGDLGDEIGHALAMERADQALDRFLYGAQRITARCARSATKSLRAGDWVLVALSWLPDYATGKRGANRLAQVVAVKDVDPAWRELTLVDAGPENQPVSQPTLGTLAAGADGVVAIPVNTVPAGTFARVEYAVPPTGVPQPGDWRALERVSVPTTLETPPLSAGATVYVRARGEAPGRRPSAYTNAKTATLPQTPRVSEVRVDVEPLTRVATVSWVAGPYARGVRIRSGEHAPDAEPVLSQVLDADAAPGWAVLPAPVTAGKTLTVEVEPWSTWSAGALSGAPGARATAQRTLLAADAGRVRVGVESFDNGSTGTLRLTLDDPDALVTAVKFVVTGGDGARSAPQDATRIPGGGVYEKDVGLHPQHNVSIEPVLTLSDGSTLRPGSETFDLDRSANLVGRPQVSYDGGQATVSATADSDTASLHVEEWNGSAWVVPAERGAVTKFADGQRGSFTLPASTTAKRRLRVFGKSAAGLAGPAEEVEIDRYRVPTPAVAKFWAVVDSATSRADLHLLVDGPAAVFPVTVELYADNPSGSPLLLAAGKTSHTFATPGLQIGPATYAALHDVQLPKVGGARWWARLMDAQGNPPGWAFTSADRDLIPGGTVTPEDFQPAPRLVCAYDDDTTGIVVHVPGGKKKTYTGLTTGATPSGQVVTYVAGTTVLDDASVESAYRIGELRAGYRVEYNGGGLTAVLFSGPLHGKPPQPPVCEPTVSIDATLRDRVDVSVKIFSPADEEVGLHFRESDAPAAPIWQWVSPGTLTPKYTGPAGGTVGPADQLAQVGAASTAGNAAKLNDILLVRDQVRRIWVRAIGRDSGVEGAWTPVVLEAKEKPWLESIDLVWNEITDQLELTAVGGAFCQSAQFSVSSDATFAGGVRSFETAMGDGARVTWLQPLTSAERNRTWYGRVTPSNAAVFANGLKGEPARDSEFVPAGEGGIRPPSADLYQSTLTAPTVAAETLTLSGALGDGGLAPLRWRTRVDDARTGQGTWAAWSTLALPRELTVVRGLKWIRRVTLEVQDAAGRTGRDYYVVASRFDALDDDGLVDTELPQRGGKQIFRRFDLADGVTETAGRGFTLSSFLDAGRKIIKTRRLAVDEPTDNLFRTGDSADGIAESVNRSFTLASFLDAGRKIIKTRRAGVDEPVDNLFRTGDSADGVTESAGRSFTLPSFLDAGRKIIKTRRAGVDEPVDNLFRTGDPAEGITESVNRSFTLTSFLDAGRRIIKTRRLSSDEPVDNLFRKGDPASDVTDGGGRSFVDSTYVDASRRVSRVRRDGFDEPAENLFRKGTDTLGSVADGGGFRRTTLAEAEQTRFATQNLLGPDAGPAGNVVRSVTLAQAGLAVGDVVSAGAEIQGSVATDRWRVEVRFYNAANVLVQEYGSAEYAGTTYQRRVVEGLAIPANTARIDVASDNNAATTGTRTLRSVMLNRGYLALPFAEPPFRVTRETAEHVAETPSRSFTLTSFLDAGRKIIKTRRAGADEPVDNLFRTGDSAEGITESVNRSFTLTSFLDAGRKIIKTRRAGADEPVDNLFRTGDSADGITENANRSFTLTSFLDASRRVVKTRRNNFDEPVENLFRRGTDTVADVVGAESQTGAEIRVLSAYPGQLHKNPLFAKWTGVYPDGWGSQAGTPVKETTLTRNGGNGVRFTAPAAADARGIRLQDTSVAGVVQGMTNPEFLVVELDVMFVSGGAQGAGVLVDWMNTAGSTFRNANDVHLVNDLGAAPAPGVWHTVRKVVRRPAAFTGTFRGVGLYLMGNYASFAGGASAKDVVFDRLVLREATRQEAGAFLGLNVDGRLLTGLENGADIGGVAARLVARQGQGVFLEEFRTLPDWSNYTTGMGTPTIEAGQGVTGSNVLRAGRAHWGAVFPNDLPFDPSKLYRMRARVRQLDDPGYVDAFTTDTLANWDSGGDAAAAWTVATAAPGILTGDGGTQATLLRKTLSAADVRVSAEVTEAGDGGLVARWQDNGTYYLLALRDDAGATPNLQLYRRVGGAFTALAGADVAWTRGTKATLTLEVIGSTLRALFNGEEAISAVADTGIAGAGRCGLRNQGTGNRLVVDRFEVQVVGAAAALVGTRYFYFGVRAYNAAGTLVGTYWTAANAVSVAVAGGWVEVTGWIKGSLPTIRQPASDPTLPSGLPATVRYIRPVMLLNWPGSFSNGTQEVDYLAIDVLDEDAAERTYKAIGSAGAHIKEIPWTRGGNNELPTAMFKRGDSPTEVTEGGGRSFTETSYLDASRRIVKTRRSSTDEPVDNLFKRGVNTLDDVLDGSWARTTAGEKAGAGNAASHLDGSGLKASATVAGTSTALVRDGAYRTGNNLLANPGAEGGMVNWYGTGATAAASASARSGVNVFRVTGPGTIACQELVPVDPRKEYLFSFAARAVSPASTRLAPCVNCYDRNGVYIQTHEVYAPGLVYGTLAQPVAVGATSVVLTDASAFPADANAYLAFNAQLDLSDLPNRALGKYTAKSGNTLSGFAAFTQAYPSGTRVRFHRAGSTYNYVGGTFGQSIPTAWTDLSGTIGGLATGGAYSDSLFRPGTAYVTVSVIANYTGAAGDVQELDGFFFGELTFVESATGVVSGKEGRRRTDTLYKGDGKLLGVTWERSGVDEAPTSWFKKGSDTLDSVGNSATHRKTGASYVDTSGGVTGVFRNSAVESVGNLFKRGSDTLDSVANSAAYRRTGASYVDTSGGVTGVYRGSAVEPVDNLFKKGVDTVDHVIGAESQTGAQIRVDSYSAGMITPNPTFARWPAGNVLPDGYSGWNHPPGRETGLVRSGGVAARFQTNAVNEWGMVMYYLGQGAVPTNATHVYLEADFRLQSGSLNGSGVLLYFYTPAGGWLGGVGVSFAGEMGTATPPAQTWYSVRKAIPVPGGNLGFMHVYAMGNYTEFGPLSVKDLVFDRLVVRLAGDQEAAAHTAIRGKGSAIQEIPWVRGGVDEAPGNFFKRGSDTLDSVANSGSYRKTGVAYVDTAGGVVGVLRNGNVENVSNLFRRGVDGVADVIGAESAAASAHKMRLAAQAGAGLGMLVNAGFELGDPEVLGRPLGWRRVEGAGAESSIVLAAYDNRRCMEIGPTGSLAAGAQMVRVVPGRQYRVRVEITGYLHSGGWPGSGLYIRANYLTTAPPAGATHIGVGMGGVVADRNGLVDFWANAPVPTGWTAYEKVWTVPAGVHFASFAVYNWTSNTSLLVSSFLVEDVHELQARGLEYNAATGGRVRDQRIVNQLTAANKNSSTTTGGYLSGYDAGSSASIAVNPFTIQYGFGQLTYNSGAIHGLPFNTQFQVYCDDPDFLGGSVTYFATTTFTDVVSANGRIHVGTVRTPADGGGAYTGGGGGGCCALGSYLRPGLTVDDAAPGDEVDAWLPGTDGEVETARVAIAFPVKTVPCVRLESESGAALVVGRDTPLLLRSGVEVRAEHADGVELLVDARGERRWERVRVADAGAREVRYLSIGGGAYAAGEDPALRIFTHNVIALKE